LEFDARVLVQLILNIDNFEKFGKIEARIMTSILGLTIMVGNMELFGIPLYLER
jgi:hypothetical protein